LRGAWEVFSLYQTAVVAPHVFSPLQLLCGHRIASLLESRRVAACGIAGRAAAVSAKGLVFAGGRRAIITPASCKRAALKRRGKAPSGGILRPRASWPRCCEGDQQACSERARAGRKQAIACCKKRAASGEQQAAAVPLRLQTDGRMVPSSKRK